MATALRSNSVQIPGQIPLTQRYETALRLSHLIAIHRDADALFHAWVKELRSVTGLHAVGMVHYDELSHAIQWCTIDVEDQPFPFTPLIRWENSTCRLVYESQQPVLVSIDDRSISSANLLDFLAQIGVRSACILPLTTAHRKIGAIAFASEYPNSFSEDLLSFLSPLTEQLAVGMDNAFYSAALQHAHGRLEGESGKLKLLLELNNAIVSELELTSLVETISPRLRPLINVDAVALILPDPENNGFYLHALDFPGATGRLRLSATPIQHSHSIAARVFQSGEPWTGDIGSLDSSHERDHISVSGVRTVCALPLNRRNRVLGVLGLGRVHETAFAQRDIDFLRQVADQVAIALDNALTYGQIAHPGEQLYRTDPQNEDPQTWSFHEIIGRSKALGHVLQQVEAVAPTKTAALICGETGTGKELIARAIHDHSLRKKGPFIKVNCAALPAGLLESELFGHEKGAFTGASCRRCGRFELANDGTIFLDEIGELPLELQPKLLRVLQDGEFERVGSSKPLHTNARLIAATNRDLAEMVAENRFRADLFYRLNVFPLYLPPLRERREDIPLLARHFTAQATGNLGKTIDSISSEVMNALVNCVWPGNIRELQNVIERAVILSPGPTLRIPLTELKQNGTAKAGGHPVETLEEIEKRHILAILEQSNWILSGASGAAARLGMKRSTLQFRMHKLGITRPGRM